MQPQNSKGDSGHQQPLRTSDRQAARSYVSMSELEATTSAAFEVADIEPPERKKQKRKSYTAVEKLAVVAYAEKSSNRAAGRKFELAEKNIRLWRKMKGTLESMPCDKRSLRGPLQRVDTEASSFLEQSLEVANSSQDDEYEEGEEEGMEGDEFSFVDGEAAPAPNGSTPRKQKRDAETQTEDKRTRKSYTAQEKLEVIAYADKTTNRAAARFYNVDEKNIRDWRRIKHILNIMPKDCRSLRIGAQPHWPELEEELRRFVVENRAKKVKMTVSVIRLKAKQLAEDVFNITNFKATTSWAYRFLKRNDLPPERVRRPKLIVDDVPRLYNMDTQT